MHPPTTIRAARPADDDAIWAILEPTFRAGETYPIPRDINRADALAYWRSPGHSVFVAEADGHVIGTYYLRANNRGGGDHVASVGRARRGPRYVRAFARRGARTRLPRHAV
jgi:predicted N-acetyltransferase YhbS